MIPWSLFRHYKCLWYFLLTLLSATWNLTYYKKSNSTFSSAAHPVHIIRDETQPDVICSNGAMRKMVIRTDISLLANELNPHSGIFVNDISRDMKSLITSMGVFTDFNSFIGNFLCLLAYFFSFFFFKQMESERKLLSCQETGS